MALVLSCVPPASAQTLTADVTARIDAVMQKALAQSKATGMVIGVAKNGKLVYEHAYGTADVSGAPLTAESAFEIGSITKQFTSAAILQLIEAKKLSLNDPLGKYVPTYTAGRNITVRQLLNQVTGIPEYVGTVFENPPKEAGTFEGILKLIIDKPLDFAPGTKWAYSNTNYVMLGHIIELVSHQSYDAYIHDHIFVPAGMTHSTTWSGESQIANFPAGYAFKEGKLRPAIALDSGWAYSAGDIVSTVSDMLKWDNAFFGGKIISLRDVKLATTASRLPDGKSTQYGFGWIVDQAAGHPRIWHNGGTAGFLASNMTFPKDHLTLIAFENNADGVAPEMMTTNAFAAIDPSAAAAIAAAENKPAKNENAAITARAKEWIRRTQTGDVDRTQLTQTMSDALTPEIVAAAKAQLAALGEPTSIVYKGKGEISPGNMTYGYRVTFASTSLMCYITFDKDAKISGLLFRP